MFRVRLEHKECSSNLPAGKKRTPPLGVVEASLIGNETSMSRLETNRTADDTLTQVNPA